MYFIVNVNKKGFSLIELVVVLTLFLIIATVTINIFISMIQNQRRVLEEQELLNQTSFAAEYISKALRMAVKDTSGACLGTPNAIYQLTHCLNGTLEPCNGIKFINASDNNACQEFFLDESVDVLNPPLRETKNNITQNLLSDKLKTKFGRFVLNGDKTIHRVLSTDSHHPRVTFLLDILTASNQSEKIIQSTISQQLKKSGGGGGLSCNSFSQCVVGGGGVSCLKNKDCTNLSCSQSNQCVQGGEGGPCNSPQDCVL